MTRPVVPEQVLGFWTGSFLLHFHLMCVKPLVPNSLRVGLKSNRMLLTGYLTRALTIFDKI